MSSVVSHRSARRSRRESIPDRADARSTRQESAVALAKVGGFTPTFGGVVSSNAASSNRDLRRSTRFASTAMSVPRDRGHHLVWTWPFALIAGVAAAAVATIEGIFGAGSVAATVMLIQILLAIALYFVGRQRYPENHAAVLAIAGGLALPAVAGAALLLGAIAAS